MKSGIESLVIQFLTTFSGASGIHCTLISITRFFLTATTLNVSMLITMIYVMLVICWKDIAVLGIEGKIIVVPLCNMCYKTK